MKKGVKIAIAVGTGLAVGLGGWYIYQQIQKRKEAAKLAGATNLNEPPQAIPPVQVTPKPDLGTPITTGVGIGQPKLNPAIVEALSISQQSNNNASSFNGQEMVSRYQKPFWTVGG